MRVDEKGHAVMFLPVMSSVSPFSQAGHSRALTGPSSLLHSLIARLSRMQYRLQSRLQSRLQPQLQSLLKSSALIVTSLTMMLTLTACGSDPTAGVQTSSSGSSQSSGSAGSTDSSAAPGSPKSPIIVGSANFAESQILGEIYRQALTARGISATTKPNIGSREVYVRALQDGSISMIADYSGNLLHYFAPNATQTTSESIEKALHKALPSTLATLAMSPAQNADTIVMEKKRAKARGVTSLADLHKLSHVTIAAPPEFAQRSYGIPGLKKLYNVDVTLVPLSDEGGQATVNAVENGTTTLAKLTTTSPFLTDGKLIVLKDPRHLISAQNVIPLTTVRIARDTKVRAIIAAVQKKLTTADLIALNRQSLVEKKSAETIAHGWLTKHSLAK